MTSTEKPTWIAVDWGTTNLRVWIMGPDDRVLDHRHSNKGMGKLERSGFEPAVLDLINDWLEPDGSIPVVICGMAGSRQGWAEAPYKTVPCSPPGLAAATAVSSHDKRIRPFILPGVKQNDPPDVMRGEETQIAGFLADRPDYTGTLCLPGTHTKWVALTNGCIDRFQTFMTGELFALLSENSVLQHSLSEETLDRAAFQSAVHDITKNPNTLTANLFQIRAAGLVSDLSPDAARGRLSGLLIGSEIAAAANAFTLEKPIVLGSDKIAIAYADALTEAGHPAVLADADAITLRGLSIAYHSHSKDHS